MTQKYPGGFVTLTPPTLNPALGAATSGIWTLDQALNAEVTRSWPMYDPYYRNVVLNLHGDGTNGAQNNTFVDSSASPLTITRNGNTTQGSFSPYGQNYSNYFGSASGDVGLYMNGESAFAFGTGDFTIEMWVNLQSVAGFQTLIDFRPSSTQGLYPVLYLDTPTSTLRYYTNSADRITGTTAFTYNTWHHVAVTRSGTSTKVFLDGVQQGSTYTDTNNYLVGTNRPYTGYGVNSISGYMMYGGYLSNLRITKGQALYTSTFTPPTEPLTTTSQGATAANVSLLTAQSNRFVDNSSNGFTVNVTGTVSVQRFQPFLFNTSYTPSTIGGSGYFDGTGDYLTAPSNTAFAFGTGDFTVEAWVYQTIANEYPTVFEIGNHASSTGIVFLVNATGAAKIYSGAFYGSNATTLNGWNHVAWVRSSGVLKVYVNGIGDAGTAFTNNLTDTSIITSGTSRSFSPGLNYQYAGYITGLRAVKGAAVYTANFTPPTAPISTISGASLLLSTTNAAIVDNSMMNDLETVGNAQISTSVKKYGTGSLAFDGTGDYLLAPVDANQNFNFGTGDFTVEMWFYANSLSATDYAALCGCNNSVSTSEWGAYVRSNGVFFYGSAGTLTGSGTVSTSVWNHYAVTRSGSTLRVFLNGVQQASATVSGSYINSSVGFRVGDDPTGANPAFNGYIDDLRITKGVARYVANFTPPTSQLQDQ
jgi:hypothetical protein